MANTLFDAVVAVYGELGTFVDGTITGQGTDTDRQFNDSARQEPDSMFSRYLSAILIIETTDGAAPQGEWQRLYTYDQDSGTDMITVESAFSDDLTVGDFYMMTLPKYPLQMVVNGINTVLSKLDVPREDVSLTTVAGQTEYDFPSGVPKWGLRQVWIENDNSDSDNQRFTELHNCAVFHNEYGTANKIVLPREYSAGYTLKLVYVDNHARLNEDGDGINEHIPIPKLAAVVAPQVLRMKMEQHTSGDKTIGGRLAMMVEGAQRTNLQSYIPLPPKSGKLIIHRIGR